jgi:uncharacterized protein (UPF0332 family)
MSYSKEELVNYRLGQAKEVFRDAKILVANESWKSAANRMYYACFHIVSAYLAQQNIKATTHAGLKRAFNMMLVKTGKINRDDGRLFNQLFNLRQEADYEDFYVMTKEDVKPLVPRIASLIQEIEEIIRAK